MPGVATVLVVGAIVVVGAAVVVVDEMLDVVEMMVVESDPPEQAVASSTIPSSLAILVHMPENARSGPSQSATFAFHDEIRGLWVRRGSRWFENRGRPPGDPEDPFWDDIATETVEDRDVILEQAMIDAHQELTGRLGDDPTAWRWADLHTASFQNLTFGQSGIAPVEWLFNRTAPKRLGGGADTVNAVGFYLPEGYVVDWIPSMRMVIDLSDLAASTSMNTGQSGHAFHHHYDDMLAPWADGEQRPMRWVRDQVEAAAEGTHLLVPAS